MKKLKINKLMDKREAVLDEEFVTSIEKESIELLEAITKTEEELHKTYMNTNIETQEHDIEENVVLHSSSYKRTSANIFEAYVKTVGMYDELSARWKDLQKSKEKKIIPSAPANSVIDIEEIQKQHFARGLNIYKLMLVCFIGSFAGVIIELIWCLLRYGYIESRSGLVYGPFNLLYGAGALALTVALYRFRNNGAWISFIGGFVVGSVVEYLCSWGQETLFGSRSWDYSMVPFNINGRICLLYSVFWGFLGVLWVKNLYPRMAELILKISNKYGKILTWALTIFLIFNSIVTLITVFRWSQRVDGIEASNAFFEFVDMRFPNERMERIFANMVFK